MKKIVISLVLLFLGLGISGTLGQGQPEAGLENHKTSTIGFLTGFYFMQDEVFQEIYGKSALFFGGEYTLRFPVTKQHGLDVAVGFRQLKKSGETSYTKEATQLRLTNLSLALRYSLDYGHFTFFLGPGFDYVTYKETYTETFPINSVEGDDTGFHIAGGGYCNFLPSISIKAYFRYCAVATEPEGFRVNLGGTEWGLGLVYRFEF